jgi:signal transduction histidine kinase
LIASDLLLEADGISGQKLEIQWVTTCEAALSVIESESPDIILVDYRLGDRSGLDFLRIATTRGCKTPIIVLTGQEDYTLDQEALQSGAADYLVKGQMTSNLLERAIRHAIERKQSEEALRQRESQYRELANQAQTQAQQLEKALLELKQTQVRLLQSAKMTSLGQLVAGIAHEINNPINFIYGNIVYADRYVENLIHLLQLYQHTYPVPTPEIQAEIEDINLEFLVRDITKILKSMKGGAERISSIVLSLRIFSRLDEAVMKSVDVHEGLDSTLMLLQGRLAKIAVIKDYGDLPQVECYAGQLNQAFMNILANAIDALQNGDLGGQTAARQDSINENQPPSSTIWICTQTIGSDRISIKIANNGPHIPKEKQSRLFEPFFTTKSVGKGMGMGLAISYQIVVEGHGGELKCRSEPDQDVEFMIEIPSRQPKFEPQERG